MKFLISVLAVTSLLLTGTAFATGNGDGECDHPVFVEIGCGGEQGPPGRDGKDGKDGKDGRNGRDGEDGRDGTNGIDGKDGKDGKDGTNGIDGKDGRDGIDGINGKDGVVSEEWIKEVRYFNEKYSRYMAASQAVQIHLPQDSSSRLTLGIGRSASETGFGVGYAYKFDNDRNTAVTVGVGTSGGEQVAVATFGFEFGADRVQEISYDARYAEQEQRMEDLERKLAIHQEEVELMCQESNERMFTQCVSK